MLLPLVLSEGGRKSAQKNKDVTLESPAEEDPGDKGYWITSLPSGERIATQALPNGAKVMAKKAQVCTASDPHSQQVGLISLIIAAFLLLMHLYNY